MDPGEKPASPKQETAQSLGAISSDVAARLIEPPSVTARKYLTAVDSIMPDLRPALPKIEAGIG